jgi:tetratricopeptide (TPR) repeat protein
LTPPRYAFIRFENLSGDASLGWVTRAASEVLSRSLAQALDGPVLREAALVRAGGPGVSSERDKAELAGATQVVTGYLERVGGKLRLSATEEDLATHRTVRILSAEAAQPMPALQQLARSFSAKAAADPSVNPEILKLYATALGEPADRALPGLREATRIDPNFGPAWVALADAANLTGNREQALAVAGDALGRKIDPYDKAALRLDKAVWENDKAGGVAALRGLVAVSPGDFPLLRSLAENESGVGQFAQSANDWRKITDGMPNDRDAWNQLGYTKAWSGDFAGALATMKEYASRWPDDPNPIDSAGDVDYMYGKFAEAAAYYLRANDKNPQFLNGGELFKAAWAQFRAGDKAKADVTFAQFRALREKSGSAGFAPYQSDWLFRTGREKEALALLRKESATVTPNGASGLWAQLVIEDLLTNDRAAAAKDAAIDATKAPSNVSSVARFAALPSASTPEWRKRADILLRGPGIESARRFALGVALLLDGKKQDALPLWEQIAQDAPGTDFFPRILVAKLKGERLPVGMVPDSSTVNPLLALADQR